MSETTSGVHPIDPAAGLAKAKVLAEALPALQRLAGATVVVKYGGNAMIDDDLRRACRQIAVDGGPGPRIAEMRGLVVHAGQDQVGQTGKARDLVAHGRGILPQAGPDVGVEDDLRAPVPRLRQRKGKGFAPLGRQDGRRDPRQIDHTRTGEGARQLVRVLGQPARGRGAAPPWR